MVVWKVTCKWYQENDYSACEYDSTEIGIFTSKPLAALAALDFIESMNRKRKRHYLRVISGLWGHSIDISEYDLSDSLMQYSYEFAEICFTEVTLNNALTY